MIALYDTFHIRRDGLPALTFSGLPAKLLSELAAVGAPVAWESVARELWRDEDRGQLRRRFDVVLSRLRRKLRAARLRADLVRADGAGNFELFLYDGDEVENRS